MKFATQISPLLNYYYFKFLFSVLRRLDSNIESKSSNNTYLNIIEIFNKLSKKIKHYRIAKFDNNIELRKIAILRQKSEFLSHQKVRQNKSPAPTLTIQHP